MKPTMHRIMETLDERGINYIMMEHDPVYTSQQAAKARGTDIKTGVKALVTKTQNGEFILILVRADRKADLKVIADHHGGGRISLASPSEVLEVTGCEPGAVPPFGFGPLKTYLDRSILKNREVNFNCGQHTTSIRMRTKDLLSVIEEHVLV